MTIAQKITDSMKNDSDKDIRPGSETCPSCKNGIWQSARMVVMEGTTNAKGIYTATANTAAKQCGGVKELLLSDRWFSWDYPIEADIGLNASTGLVQEVKRFMVEYGPAVQMPLPPPEPNLTSSVRNVLKDIREPPLIVQAPTEPISSEVVEESVKSKEPRQSKVTAMLAWFLMIIVPSMAGLIGVNFFFGKYILSALPVFIIVPLIIIIATINAPNRKAKIAEVENNLKDIENGPEPFEQYAKDRVRFQEDAERFRIRYEQSERKLREDKMLLEEETKAEEEAAIYKQRLAEYENKKRSVLKTRELLWDRTRLCMRCGTAYLGPG